MKLTFSFTDTPDIATLAQDNIYNSYFEIPDDARYLIGYESRIVAVATAIGQLSEAMLHLTCGELDIRNQPIKVAVNQAMERSLNDSVAVGVVCFERAYGVGQRRQVKIYQPISLPAFRQFIGSRSLTRSLLKIGDWWCKTEQDHAYAAATSALVDQLLMLLNAESSPHQGSGWYCRGFHPYWKDSSLIDRHNKRLKKQRAEEREHHQRAERLQAQANDLNNKPLSALDVPKTGAGRRYGARPGKFMGVQMRSQLEIRFAAELEERGIRWVYEGEVLGEGGYLVDFYLPELACWVEVKGQFEPRDNYLLKEVAGYLQRERNQRLFVYTQTKAIVVNSDGFHDMSREAFWAAVLDRTQK